MGNYNPGIFRGDEMVCRYGEKPRGGERGKIMEGEDHGGGIGDKEDLHNATTSTSPSPKMPWSGDFDVAAAAADAVVVGSGYGAEEVEVGRESDGGWQWW